MSEASQYFVAELGDATAEVEARLAQWGEGCVKHRFVRDERNRAALYFARAEGRTVRQMQSLIRTLTARWGVPLGQLGAGWLRALTLDEFRANVPAVGANEGGEGRSMSEAAEPPPLALVRLPCAATYITELPEDFGAYITELPEDFGVRSHALLAKLRAQAAAC